MEQQQFYEKLGDRIRHVRTTIRKISQEDFADRVGLSRPSIVNIEKGRQHVSSYQLVMFAIALGISPMQLLGVEEAQKEPTNISNLNNLAIPEHLQEWFNNAN